MYEYLAPDRKTEQLLDMLIQREKVTFRSDKKKVPQLWRTLNELRNEKLIHMSCDERLHEQTLFLRNKTVRKGKKWGKPLYVWDHTFTPKVLSLDDLLKI